MFRKLAIFAAVIAAFAVTCQGADAKSRKHHTDKRLVAVSLGVGAASTATYLSINDWNVNHWNATSITQFGAYAGTTIGSTQEAIRTCASRMVSGRLTTIVATMGDTAMQPMVVPA